MERIGSSRTFSLSHAGGTSVIPARSNGQPPDLIDGFVYALRNQIERCFNKLKCSRRLATRYDKIAESYLGFINITVARLWLSMT